MVSLRSDRNVEGTEPLECKYSDWNRLGNFSTYEILGKGDERILYDPETGKDVLRYRMEDNGKM